MKLYYQSLEIVEKIYVCETTRARGSAADGVTNKDQKTMEQFQRFSVFVSSLQKFALKTKCRLNIPHAYLLLWYENETWPIKEDDQSREE